MATQGLWNLTNGWTGGQINLPDFGVTEWLNNALGGNTILKNVNNPLIKPAYAAEDTTTTTSNGDGNGGGGGSWGDGGNQKTPPPGGTDPLAGFDMKYYVGWDPNAAKQDWISTKGAKAGLSGGSGGEDLLNQGYNDYFAQLDDIINNGLPSQRSNQEKIIQNQYTQNAGDLNNQLSSGLTDFQGETTKANQNQANNLRDLADNIRNMFMGGNVMLGSRGAGDSSAANQYAYALNKLGTQQRTNIVNNTSNILADINSRVTKFKNDVTTALNNLAQERDSKILELANWFNEQQNSLKQAKGQASLQKSQQLLSMAMQQLQNIQSDAVTKRSQLDQWAMNNAKDFNQLKSNLAMASQYKPELPTLGQISGTPSFDAQGNMSVPLFYGNSSTNKKWDAVKGQWV